MKVRILLQAVILCLFACSLAALENYTVSIDDLLEFNVHDEPDLSVTLRVSSEGSINYPLLGDVKVEGFTIPELESRITTALSQDYLIHPKVHIAVKEYSSIYVVGEVNNPGPYKLTTQTTVMGGIAMAGGFTDLGDSGNILIIRKTSKGKQLFDVDLSQVSDEGEDIEQVDMTLRPNDVVRVMKLQNINILGEVKNPGQYPVQEHLTVVEAITLAGGFTKIASPNRTRVIRTENGKKKAIPVPVAKILKRGDKKKDIPLKPNDIIIVPESFL